MAITPIKALLFLAGGVAAAGAVAYVVRRARPAMERPSETIAALPEAGQADPKDAAPAGHRAARAAPQAPAQPAAPEAGNARRA